MIRLRLDPHSGEPLGLQITRQIRLAVASGRLAAGARLPSARDLAMQLRVNFHTVRKAFGDLEREGVLSIERGRGTFVAAQTLGFRKAELRAYVRRHIKTLLGDLAGSSTSWEDVEAMWREEWRRARKEEKK